MDIFTTALAQVRANPIKPEDLRVKALRKEQAMRELTDDTYHLENHQLYFIDEKTHQKRQQQQKQQGQQKDSAEQPFEEGIKASEDVPTHKQEILHPHKSHDSEDDDDVKHLDIFI